MKLSIPAAALFLVTVPVLAQTERTGVSMPPPDNYSQDADTPPAKPSAAKPMVTESVPSQRTSFAETSSVSLPAPVQTPAATLKARTAEDPDAGIVTSVPSLANEIPQGTVIRVQLDQEISTIYTPINAPFTARVTQDIVKDGRVVVPAGSQLVGRVTDVRGGKRIRGAALLHLEPQRINLPDGTHFVLHAQVTDTDQLSTTRIGSEGDILRRDHSKQTLGVMALTTGGGAAAGAIVGGGVGALVGAGVGAGVSTAVWLKQDRQLVLAKDSMIDFSLNLPLITTPLKN